MTQNTAQQTRPPVFIHCFPRVGSTWFGDKFMRALGDAYFYEPSHELLIDGTEQDAMDEFERLRQGKSLRHPARDKPYFHNYPFQESGGVPGFQKRFCYDDYVMQPDEDDPEYEAYWKGLIDFARTKGPVPAFKDTQTSLKQGWMKAHLGGVHIYLVQHPRLTDKSFHSFRGFSNRYIREFALILARNADHPAFREIFNWAAVEPPAQGLSIDDEVRHYSKPFAAKPENRDPRFTRQYHYNAYCFLWMMGLAHASRHADVIVDMEALHDDDKRTEIEQALKDKTGLDIDLSDYKPKISKQTIGEENFMMQEDVLDIIRRALPHMEPDWDRLRALPLSRTTENAIHFFARPSSAATAPKGGQTLFAQMPKAPRQRKAASNLS